MSKAKISDLTPDPRNANKGTIRGRKALDESLRKYGAGRSILVDKYGRVIAGNKTLEVAADIGLEDVVIVETDGNQLVAVKRTDLDLDDNDARMLAYYDNRSGQLDLEWDAEQLQADMLAGVELGGLFDDDELKDILGNLAAEPPDDPGAQIDRAEELRERWGVELGQLWRIPSKTAQGEHRIVCGDCTDRAAVERVMGGERAQLCFTSPPYAEQRKEQYNSIDGAVYWDWFQVVQREIRQSLEDCGNFILNIKPHAKDLQRSLYVFDLVCSMVRSAGWLFVDEFCWLRTGIPQQVVHRYKNSFEPCYWFVASSNYKWYPEGAMHKSDSVPIALGPGAGDTNAARRQGKGGGAIQGNRIAPGMAYPSNVLDLRQNADAIGHPAAFPVQLPEFFLSSMTIVGDSALDPFLGSGTTLVACERLARLGRGIEISPAYVAVALQRLADMGLSPELVS